MERIPVTSSTIQSIGYDAESQILEIQFHSGGVYQYSGVPEYEHAGIMSAESHGKYFHANIRNRYPYLKL